MRGLRLLSVVYFMACTIGCFGQEGTKGKVICVTTHAIEMD